MKIIEAMKRIKTNKAKIEDLRGKINAVSAHMNFETPVYGIETATKIREWAQSCNDLSQECVKLLLSIQRTNLQTLVTIQVGEKHVTKPIAEWVWRRREYAALDRQVWASMTDRNLREGNLPSSTGVATEAKIIRNYDPLLRDAKIAEYSSEPGLIDGALEVVNAITDLAE